MLGSQRPGRLDVHAETPSRGGRASWGSDPREGVRSKERPRLGCEKGLWQGRFHVPSSDSAKRASRFNPEQPRARIPVTGQGCVFTWQSGGHRSALEAKAGREDGLFWAHLHLTYLSQWLALSREAGT